MKIKRVNVLSFAISDKVEQKLDKKFGGREKKGDEILKGYTPLCKFRLKRMKEVGQAGLGAKKYITLEDYLYVSLTNADIYLWDKQWKKIKQLDLLRKIIDYPKESVEVLGRLVEYGSTPRKDINKDIVDELAREGIAYIYEPRSRKVAKAILYVIEELEADAHDEMLTQDVVTVVPEYHIDFEDPRYNMDHFFETIDILDESYIKHPIKYSPDKLATLLEWLSNGRVVLDELIYLPCITHNYSKHMREGMGHDLYFPLCFKGDKKKVKKYKQFVKLKPIALMTKIDTPYSIPLETSTINFSDVVDLEGVKKVIKDTIIYPISHPDLAKEFGMKGGGSMLLYGPPGCGKTYIAKAIIGECNMPFFNANANDIAGKGEEGVKRIHTIFEMANRYSPSVIFFDEIDAVGGKRVSTQDTQARKEIDQLLTEMDGIESLKQDVLIISATNSPWDVDPALRRAGRFTRQIFVPPPNSDTRIKIFQICTKDKPLSDDINFEKLAKLIKGYSSADIKAICDEAAEIPWEEAIQGGVERKIEMRDFLAVLDEHKSSLIPWFKTAEKEIRNVGEIDVYEEFAKHILKYAGGVDQAKKPEIDFSNVGGLEHVKEEIRKGIIYPIKRPELAEQFGTKIGGGILLYGPPGCGKTYVARATARECDASFFNIKITDILSKKEGESEKNIHEIFERASRNTPAIIFFDELDAIGGARGLTQKRAERRLVNQLLSEMDGFEEIHGLMVIAATNVPWEIDPALRRAGRFTKQILVPAPDLDTRIKILQIYTKNNPLSEGVDLKELAKLTDAYSSADIKAICEEAVEIPWEEALRGGKERKITMSDFFKVMDGRKSSLIPWIAVAKHGIMDSGEEKLYKDLLDNMSRFEESWRENRDFLGLVQEEKKRLSIYKTTKEKKVKKKGELVLGYTYLEEEDKPKKSFELFINAVLHGFRGLCITRTNPKRIRDEYNLQKTPILWLTDVQTDKETVVAPQLEQLFSLINEFIKTDDRNIVLLDGVEYLISNNDFSKVLHLIQYLRDRISERNSILIMPINPAIFDKKELKQLEREMDVVERHTGGGS